VNAHNGFTGISWTLDRERAEWFARRFSNEHWPGVVITGQVKRERIIALINDRQEREVVVFPRYVYNRAVGRLAPRPAGQ
jgi:hypothetical protein